MSTHTRPLSSAAPFTAPEERRWKKGHRYLRYCLSSPEWPLARYRGVQISKYPASWLATSAPSARVQMHLSAGLSPFVRCKPKMAAIRSKSEPWILVGARSSTPTSCFSAAKRDSGVSKVRKMSTARSGLNRPLDSPSMVRRTDCSNLGSRPDWCKNIL
jgi:hypothetical protein